MCFHKCVPASCAQPLLFFTWLTYISRLSCVSCILFNYYHSFTVWHYITVDLCQFPPTQFHAFLRAGTVFPCISVLMVPRYKSFQKKKRLQLEMWVVKRTISRWYENPQNYLLMFFASSRIVTFSLFLYPIYLEAFWFIFPWTISFWF